MTCAGAAMWKLRYFVEFRRCSPHCLVATLHKLKTNTSRRWYTDMPKVLCRSGTSDTAEGKECDLELHSMRYQQQM